jgi:hypothetical protein
MISAGEGKLGMLCEIVETRTEDFSQAKAMIS